MRVANAAPLMDFLSAQGVAAIEEGDVVRATMTAASVERVFETTVQMYKNTDHGLEWHRAGPLNAPSAVVDVTAAVYGLHDFPLPPAKNGRKGAAQDGDAFPIKPADIRKRYNVPNGARGSGNKKVRQAVAEFQGQWMNTADLKSFFRQFVPFAQSGDDSVYAYRGNHETGVGDEALLDIEYIMGVAPGIPTEFWGLRNFDFCSDLKQWLQSILNDPSPPLVFSVSYGLQTDATTFCSNYKDVDTDIMRVTGRGISLIFASGDSGSGWDGEAIWPSWPAISPWVTAVGATCFTSRNFTDEQATKQFGSGSGFSYLGEVPAWQKEAAAAFVKNQGTQLPPARLWKKYDGNYGRGNADISALGEGYQCVIDGEVQSIGGTSASTPTFSALLSLINDQLVSKGKDPLGHINPWLYQNPKMFRDVIIGSDKVSRQGFPFPYGFNTAPGWDPPTGLGTPKYDMLLQMAMQQ